MNQYYTVLYQIYKYNKKMFVILFTRTIYLLKNALPSLVFLLNKFVFLYFVLYYYYYIIYIQRTFKREDKIVFYNVRKMI